MVLLEALTLGKPIIATDIAGNRSVLGKNYDNYLVENSIKALEKRIIKYYKDSSDKNTEKVYFDSDLYNKNAMDLFYEIIQ